MRKRQFVDSRLLICPKAGSMFIGALVLVSQCYVQNSLQAQERMGGPSANALTSQIPRDRLKDLVLKAVFTTCPVSNSASSSTLFHFKTETHEVIIEYRDGWNRLITAPLSEAAKLNGLQDKALLVVGGAAYRSIQHKVGSLEPANWTMWESGIEAKREIDASYFSKEFYLDSVGITITKRANTWSFMVENHLHGPGLIDLNRFSNNKLACSVLTSADPFAAERERLRMQMRAPVPLLTLSEETPFVPISQEQYDNASKAETDGLFLSHMIDLADGLRGTRTLLAPGTRYVPALSVQSVRCDGCANGGPIHIKTPGGIDGIVVKTEDGRVGMIAFKARRQ